MPTFSRVEPDFSKWPRQKHWWVDNNLPFGTWESREGTYFTSRETFQAFEQYALLHDEAGTPIEFVPASSTKKVRQEILDEAGSLISGDREEQYGSPYDHFSEVASALNSFGFSGPNGREIKPEDVPFFQLVVKLSRILKTPDKRDSWVDVVGYGALGYEVATHDE